MGRIHRKLIKLLQAEGFSSIEIYPQYGHWRSSPYADVVRWEGTAVRGDETISRRVYSWDTMTACVRYGIEVSACGKGSCGSGWEISRREPVH